MEHIHDQCKSEASHDWSGVASSGSLGDDTVAGLGSKFWNDQSYSFTQHQFHHALTTEQAKPTMKCHHHLHIGYNPPLNFMSRLSAQKAG